MEPETVTSIRQSLRQHRAQALTNFINEFMVVLASEGFCYEDLLDALANWTDDQPKFSKVVNYLEDASVEVSRNR